MVTVLGANSVTGGYDVENSLRFNSGSSDYLLRTHGTNNTAVAKFAFSFWIKRSKIGTEQVVLTAYTDGDNIGLIRFNATDVLEIYDYQDAYKLRKVTNRVFRDTSAWYHIVISSDATVGTPVLGLYINGVQETSFSTNTDYDQNDANMFNKNVLNWIAANPYNSGSGYTNGYISEFCFIDGTANDEEDFGEFDDSGIWKPIKVSGLTFGDNGYYLEFKQAGTSQNASGMGADTSGNTDHWAVASLTAVDQTTDTCTNNFATVNPLDSGFKVNLSEGNLKFVGETADFIQQWGRTTFGVSRGKWYWEMTKIANNPCIGIVTMQSPINLALENNAAARCVIYCSGQLDGQDNSGRVNGIATSIADYADDDIVSCMMDLDNGFVYFAKNGTIQIGADDSTTGNPASGSSGTGAANPTSQLLTNQHDGVWSPLIFDNSSNPAATAIYNFGNPTVALSSGVADGNGFGNFEYAPPSGYLALCTKNLAETG